VFQPFLYYVDEAKPTRLQLAGAVEVIKRLRNTCRHSLLAFTDPNTGVEVLLVRSVLPFWVANRRLEVVLLLQDVISNADQVRELKVSVDVDLDNPVANGGLVLFLCRAGSTVENEKHRFVFFSSDLFLNVRLMFGEEFWVELDIARFVDSMNIAEAGCD
jgi:hypothetical protein